MEQQALPSPSHVSETQGRPCVTHVSETVMVQSQASGAGGPAPSSDSQADSPQLSDEQQRVLELVLAGRSVFFTGDAGTGKSFLLNRIIDALRQKHGADFASSVAVTAATGIAATHIGGSTLHSAMGCGIPRTTDDFKRMWKRDNVGRLRGLRALVIDEVSMVSAEFFHLLESMCRQIRGLEAPFGGLQLILSGDFFQLPPIVGRFQPGLPKNVFLNRGFTFQTPTWQRCNLECVVLTKVWRQADQAFVRVLNAVRFGDNSAAARLHQQCCRPLPEREGVKPTQLFSRNADVDRVNAEELAKLPAPPVVCRGQDDVALQADMGEEGGSDLSPAERARQLERLRSHEFFRDCMAAPEVQLKVGAQVMLVKNLELGGASRMLVNGSRGVVAGFIDRQVYLAQLQQEMAEAKRQLRGLGLEALEQRGAAGARLDRAARQVQMVSRWGSLASQVPVVRFLNGRELPLGPVTFSAELAGVGVCSRVQVPLRCAWAITIHKCQGLTLDLARVSLRNCFADGQAYVALSRVRSLEGLQVMDISHNCVKTSPVVLRFHAALRAGQAYQDEAWAVWQRTHACEAPPPEDPSEAAMLSGVAVGGSSGGGQYMAAAAAAGGYGGGGRRSSEACFRCGQTGHWAPQRPMPPGSGGPAGSGAKRAAPAQQQQQEQQPWQQAQQAQQAPGEPAPKRQRQSRGRAPLEERRARRAERKAAKAGGAAGQAGQGAGPKPFGIKGFFKPVQR